MGSTYTWTIAPKLHTRALALPRQENATRDDARSDSASLEPRARVLSPDVSRRARCAKSTAVGAGGVPRRAVRGCARRRGRRTRVWAPTVLLNFPRVAPVRFKGQVQSAVSLSRRAPWFQRPRSRSPSSLETGTPLARLRSARGGSVPPFPPLLGAARLGRGQGAFQPRRTDATRVLAGLCGLAVGPDPGLGHRGAAGGRLWCSRCEWGASCPRPMGATQQLAPGT